MMKIEPHGVLPGREVCVWYIDGTRVAVIYVDESTHHMKIVHERNITAEVLMRAGLTSFVDVTKESYGKDNP
jgi:hypothetical protein